MTVLNYGERQPGAEDVLLHLSRPVAGQQTFDATNGDATFSASGAYLLLTMPFLLITMDAQTMQAWHFALPQPNHAAQRRVGRRAGGGQNVGLRQTNRCGRTDWPLHVGSAHRPVATGIGTGGGNSTAVG